MTTIVDVDATWVNPASVAFNASELRLADAAMFAGRGDTYGARGGIVAHSDNSLLVTVDGSDLVTVKAGSVVIPGTAVAGSGVWRTGIGADQSHALAARDATNPRIDLVVFRQLDTDVVGSHGAYTARLQIIEGTPSATPAVPALPSMAVELARINVPASGGGAASADLTKRQFAAALGGTMKVPTASQLPAAAAKWQRAVALDTGIEYAWTGSAWIMVGTAAAAADLFTGTEHSIGTVPAAGTRKITKQGTDVVTTIATGEWTLNLPEAFPNAVVTQIVGNGDGNAYGGTVTVTGGTLSTITGRTNPALVSANLRVNYIAVGW